MQSMTGYILIASRKQFILCFRLNLCIILWDPLINGHVWGTVQVSFLGCARHIGKSLARLESVRIRKAVIVFLTLPSICKWREIIHWVLSIGLCHRDSRVLSSVYDILRHINCWDDMLWQIFKKVYPWALNCSNYAFSITVAYQGALPCALGKEAEERTNNLHICWPPSTLTQQKPVIAFLHCSFS